MRAAPQDEFKPAYFFVLTTMRFAPSEFDLVPCYLILLSWGFPKQHKFELSHDFIPLAPPPAHPKVGLKTHHRNDLFNYPQAPSGSSQGPRFFTCMLVCVITHRQLP